MKTIKITSALQSAAWQASQPGFGKAALTSIRRKIGEARRNREEPLTFQMYRGDTPTKRTLVMSPLDAARANSELRKAFYERVEKLADQGVSLTGKINLRLTRWVAIKPHK